MESGDNKRHPGNLDQLIRKGIDDLDGPEFLKASVPEYLRAVEMLREMEPGGTVKPHAEWMDSLD